MFPRVCCCSLPGVGVTPLRAGVPGVADLCPHLTQTPVPSCCAADLPWRSVSPPVFEGWLTLASPVRPALLCLTGWDFRQATDNCGWALAPQPCSARPEASQHTYKGALTFLGKHSHQLHSRRVTA